MNCKIGDLAIIIRGKTLAGRIVEIVGIVPKGVDFRLPDGYLQLATQYEWVIRFVGSPVEAPIGTVDGMTGTRTTFYGCAPDHVLRPVSGLPITDDIEDEVTA